MSATVIVLERVIRFAPFGVRFWDPATQALVTTGLDITHRPRPTAAAIHAMPNRSGVFVLRGLPGLGPLERAAGDEASPPAARRYRIEVTDAAGRFLPVAFNADLPAPSRGLFDSGCTFPGSPPWTPALGSPPGSPPSRAVPVVPLFSAPARPVPPGMAVLRAQLELLPSNPSGQQGTAASWALLEVSYQGRSLGLGATDGNGLGTVVFPYPEPMSLELSPPGPGPGAVRLSDQSWTLGVQAYFGGGSAPAGMAAAPPSGIPDLCDLLDQQSAMLLDESGAPLTSVLLRYGRELVVRASPRSTVLLVPAGSPPSP